MARRRPETDPAADAPTKKGVTPPKGRPTRSRRGDDSKRLFGPVAQWITVALVLTLVVVALIVAFDGGDFNPLNDDDQLPSQFGAPAAAPARAG